MKTGVITLRISFFILLAICGVLLAVMSFTVLSPDFLPAKGIRAVGLLCLFLGIGEYLNHPVQKKLNYNDRDETGPITILHRSRNPCGLGNTFDVLALINLFIALSFFFFPHQP